MVLKIEDFNFELRKINAIKIQRQQTESDKKESEDEKPRERTLPELGIHLRRKEDKKVQLNVIYRVPSNAELDVEIDAEFVGSISLNEPLDIKRKDTEESTQFKDFVNKILMPKILKELDRMLFPLYNSMSIEYKFMSPKKEEDFCEVENHS